MSNQHNVGFVPVDFDPFAQSELEAGVPATEPQIEILTACLLGGEDANRSYNESNSLQLRGQMNKPALQKALQELVNRHEALRASFSSDGNYILIGKVYDLKIAFNDLSSLDEARKDIFLQTFLRNNAITAFNLQQGPLFRVALFKLADDLHHLTLTAHHIVCDGWSFGILLEELGQLYSAFAKGENPQLTQAPSFLSFALEQKKFKRTSRYQETEKYWISQFREDVPVLDLPTDFPRPTLRTYTGQRLDFSLPKETTRALKQLGAKSGCSFVTTLLAAFELFIHKLSGQDKIVIGLPAAGQSATEHYGLVGHCVNLLPLRSEVDESRDFLVFLRKQKSVVLDAYDHQLFTFGSLLQKLPIRRDASRVPLVPVVFNIDMGMDNKVKFSGLSHQKTSNPRAFEAFELFLNVNGHADSLVFEWSYNTQLFQPSSIRKWMASFEYLLQEIISHPDLPVKELSLTDPKQVLSIYNHLNATATAYPKNLPLHQLIAEQANRFPEQVIVTSKDEKLTYRELNESANQLARLLQKNGVQQGDAVGLLMDRTPQLIAMLLAVMKAGAFYLPIDPSFPTDRIQFMLQDAGAKLIVVSKANANRFVITAQQLAAEDLWKQKAKESKENVTLSVRGEDLIYLLYTSGSTGKPKGVRIRHYNLVNFLCSIQQSLQLTAADTLAAITTISFDISCLEIYLPLLSGAKIHLIESETAKDGNLLLDIIKIIHPTIMQATPSTWQMLLDVGWQEKHTIKSILCGGEALTKNLADKLLPRCQSLINLYGPTETTVWSTIKKIESGEEIITIGRPIANTQVYLLDKDGKPVPENTVGEIFISGDGVADGYFNREKLTKEKFLNDPFAQTARMYRTGDLGKLLPNGDLQCLGRVDQQVKIRGYRIEPEEIEACLHQQPQIRQAVVIARERPKGYTSLLAYVVLNPAQTDKLNDEGTSRLVAQWIEALKKELPAYMVPGEILILPQLPLTPNGKIDKNALPDFTPGVTLPVHKDNDPATPQEKIIIEIWRHLLGVDSIGRHDDFFNLGGHSLIAVKMMRLVEKETGVRLPLATLYEHSTVEKMAAQLNTSYQEGDDDCLVPIRPEGSRTPFYYIHGALGDVFGLPLLTKHLHLDQPVFGIRAKDLTGTGNTQNTIEEIAASYVAILLRQNPEGPYILIGYCFGGLVAFEMTKQMQRMGKKVKKLIVVDAEANVIPNPDVALANRIRAWKGFAKRRKYDISYFLKDPKVKIRYEKLKLTESLVKVKRNLVGPKNDPFYIAAKLERKCFAAIKKYKLTPYEGSMYLFRAGKRVRYTADNQYLGWRPYVKGEIRIYDVPGIHSEIFAFENSRTTAAVLQRCLDDDQPYTEDLAVDSFHSAPLLP
ncbi:MAG TPA: amino acid adenylation domain-containing protein [Flavisolibacter sp.]|jgi:amino acid adenylation domain-containing protein|nr:amino acid adenylation domain-containing protein [Flavisolibacter sp.]